MSKDNGGPAFPSEQYAAWDDPAKGMTLRDYFAAKAMVPMIENRIKGSLQYGNEKDMALRAYEIADAMLESRK